MTSLERNTGIVRSHEASEGLISYRPLRLIASSHASIEVAERAAELNTAFSLFDLFKAASGYAKHDKEIRKISQGNFTDPESARAVIETVALPLLEAGVLIGQIRKNQETRGMPLSSPDSLSRLVFAQADLNEQEKERIISTRSKAEQVSQSVRGRTTGQESLTPADTIKIQELMKKLILDAEMDELTKKARVLIESFQLETKPVGGTNDQKTVESEDDIVTVQEQFADVFHDAYQKLTAVKSFLDLSKRKPALLVTCASILTEYDEIIDKLSEDLRGEVNYENIKLTTVISTIDGALPKNLAGTATLEELDPNLLLEFFDNPHGVYFSPISLKILVGNLTDNARKSFQAEPEGDKKYGVKYEIQGDELAIKFEQIGGKLIPERFINTGYTRGDTEWDDRGILLGQGLGMYRQVKILEAANANLKVGYITDPDDHTVKIGSVHELRLPLVKAGEQS